MDYARNTSVSIDSSRAEVDRLLRRAGAQKCMSGWDDDSAFVAFVMDNVPVKLSIQMPKKEKFVQTETGRQRKQSSVNQAWEQACRQRMREFCLLLKSKLVSVSIGLRSIEHEFYADICLPSTGKTIFETQGDFINEAITSGKLQPLLPGF